MVGAVHEAGSHAPESLGKNQRKEEEEGAGHLQPQDAAHSAEGTQKAARATRHAAGSKLRDGSPRRLHVRSESAHSVGSSRLSCGRICGGARPGGHALAGYASCNP